MSRPSRPKRPAVPAFAKSVPAVFENGALRFLGPPPFTEGQRVTVRAVPAETETADAQPGRPPDGGGVEAEALKDPLLDLIGIVKDGPPDWSEHFDDYRFGRREWPAESNGDGSAGAAE